MHSRSSTLTASSNEGIRSNDSVTRHLYYQVYSEDGAIHAKNAFPGGDPYIGCINARHIRPPHTASSVKLHLCKQEQIDAACTRLFLTILSTDPLDDGVHMPLLHPEGPGSIPEEPLALVVDSQSSNNYSNNGQLSAQSNQDAFDRRNSNRDHIPISRRFSVSGLFHRIARHSDDDSVPLFNPTPAPTVTPAAMRIALSEAHPYTMTTIRKCGGWPGYLAYKRGDTLWADDLTVFGGRIRAFNLKGQRGFVARDDVEIGSGQAALSTESEPIIPSAKAESVNELADSVERVEDMEQVHDRTQPVPIVSPEPLSFSIDLYPLEAMVDPIHEHNPQPLDLTIDLHPLHQSLPAIPDISPHAESADDVTAV